MTASEQELAHCAEHVGSPIGLAKSDLGAGWRIRRADRAVLTATGGLVGRVGRRHAMAKAFLMVEEAKITNKSCASLGSGGCRSAGRARQGRRGNLGQPILAARSDLANASKETAHDELSVPGSPAVPLVAEEPAPSAHGPRRRFPRRRS